MNKKSKIKNVKGSTKFVIVCKLENIIKQEINKKRKQEEEKILVIIVWFCVKTLSFFFC